MSLWQIKYVCMYVRVINGRYCKHWRSIPNPKPRANPDLAKTSACIALYYRIVAANEWSGDGLRVG